MYMHTFTCVCESRRRFSPLLSLKYLYISFFLPACSLPAPSLLPSIPARSAPQARGHPCPSLPLSAFPPLVLRSSCSCCVFRGCRVSPAVSPWLVPCVCCVCALEALRRPSVCRSVCPAACPSLVHHQAQDAVTVWADAPRIYPRPCLLLPMCCRVFRCPFRVLSCGFLPCVRVCVLLPCVVRRQ